MRDALMRGGVADDHKIAGSERDHGRSSRHDPAVGHVADLVAAILFAGLTLIGVGSVIVHGALDDRSFNLLPVGLALAATAAAAVVAGISSRRILTRRLEASIAAQVRAHNADILSALDHLPMGVAVWDSDRRLVAANRLYRETTPRVHQVYRSGTELEDTVETEIDGGYVDPGNAERWRDNRRTQQLGAGQVIRRSIDGREYRISAHVTAGDGSVTVSEDVTALEERETALKELEERYTVALAAANEGLWDLDLRTGRLYASPRALGLVGLDGHGGAFNRRDWISRIHAGDRLAYRRAWRAHLKGETPAFNAEYRVRTNDGTYRWVHDRALALRDSTGKAYRITGAIADVSVRKATEEELSRLKEQAEVANRAKSEFLAGISHELRTPLNAIVGFSSLVRDAALEPETVRDFANDIHTAGTQLDGIITDMIDIARADLGRLELAESSVDLATCTDAVLRVLAAHVDDKALDVGIDLPDNLPTLIADEAKVKQIIHNVLSNAIKFTPRNGRIVVDAGCNLSDGLRLSVRDSGVGMSRAEIARVAEPFAKAGGQMTAGSRGPGLGLAIVGAYMRLHGGRFEIDSSEDGGTVVNLTFPPERIA